MYDIHYRVNMERKGALMCDLCQKSFPQLEIHKRSHTGEKPFKCDLSEKAFRKLAHLICHKLSHSGKSSLEKNHLSVASVKRCLKQSLN